MKRRKRRKPAPSTVTVQSPEQQRLDEWAKSDDAAPERLREVETDFRVIAESALQADQLLFGELAEHLACLCEIAQVAESENGEPCGALSFVQKTLPLLLEALEGNSEDSRLREAVDQARQQWGDEIDLLISDTEVDAVVETEGDTELPTDEEAPPTSPEQIETMLSVLSSGPTDGAGDNGKADEQTAEPVARGASVPSEEWPAPLTELTSSDVVASDPSLRDAYLDDAEKCLATMEEVVLDAEQESSSDAECVRTFCQQLHTLKGASASVSLVELAAYLHQVEEWLEQRHRKKSATIKVEALLQCVDSVRKQIELLKAPTAAPPSSKTTQATPTTQRAAPAKTSTPVGGASFSASAGSIRIQSKQLSRLMDMLAELVVLRNRRETQVEEINRWNNELARCSSRLHQLCEQPVELNPEGGLPGGGTAANYVNSSNSIEELAQDVREISNQFHKACQPVSEENQTLSHFIRHFRHELMQLKRLPLSGLFKRLMRSARDVARTENKKLVVKLQGEHVGLEQSVQDGLFEPLLHIVRNAVSHGIEDPAARLKSGKRETGTLTVEATANANMLVVKVSDDGGGLDYDALRRKGIERGMLSPASKPSRQDLANLIFAPAFSTRETTSQVSGRGVGMDVVATTIKRMFGRIDVDSTPGKGTTISLAIPLRSGIEHVMLFRSGGQLFALPMQSVRAARATELEGDGESVADDSVKAEQRKIVFSKVMSLGSAADIDDRQHLESELLVLENHEFDDSDHQGTGGKVGILVEQVLGAEEVVVRELPETLKNHPFLSGITLSGRSEIVLVMDGYRLAEFCNGDGLAGVNFEDKGQLNDVRRHKTRQVLVVDDSLSSRKVLVDRFVARGIATVEAADGMEALECLRKNHFDLIVTDLDMPRLGGMELLVDIQNNSNIQSPVYVVSSRNEEPYRSRVMQCGAQGFISKPLTDESFAEILNQIEVTP